MVAEAVIKESRASLIAVSKTLESAAYVLRGVGRWLGILSDQSICARLFLSHSAAYSLTIVRRTIGITHLGPVAEVDARRSQTSERGSGECLRRPRICVTARKCRTLLMPNGGSSADMRSCLGLVSLSCFWASSSNSQRCWSRRSQVNWDARAQVALDQGNDRVRPFIPRCISQWRGHAKSSASNC
jgi:hypothetical protein